MFKLKNIYMLECRYVFYKHSELFGNMFWYYEQTFLKHFKCFTCFITVAQEGIAILEYSAKGPRGNSKISA